MTTKNKYLKILKNIRRAGAVILADPLLRKSHAHKDKKKESKKTGSYLDD